MKLREGWTGKARKRSADLYQTTRPEGARPKKYCNDELAFPLGEADACLADFAPEMGVGLIYHLGIADG